MSRCLVCISSRANVCIVWCHTSSVYLIRKHRQTICNYRYFQFTETYPPGVSDELGNANYNSYSSKLCALEVAEWTIILSQRVIIFVSKYKIWRSTVASGSPSVHAAAVKRDQSDYHKFSSWVEPFKRMYIVNTAEATVYLRKLWFLFTTVDHYMYPLQLLPHWSSAILMTKPNDNQISNWNKNRVTFCFHQPSIL